MARVTQEDDFHNSGNLDESPGFGDNEGPEWDPEAEAARVAEEFELLNMDEAEVAKRARKFLLVKLFMMIKSGEAMPQDMANLRQLLKDNGQIMGDILGGQNDDGNPKRAKEPLPLPEFDVPDYDT